MSSVVKRAIVVHFERVAAAALLGSIVVGVLIVVLDRKLCLSENCLMISENVMDSLDTSFDPCDDFYEFACGKMLERDVMPDREHSILLSDAERKQMIKVRETMVDDGTPMGHKVDAFMKMCEEGGIPHLADKELPQIRADRGLFPSVVGDEFDEKSWSLQGASGKLREMGLDFTSLFDIDINYNPTNPRHMVLSLRNPQNLNLSLSGCDESCKAEYLQQYLLVLEAFHSTAAGGEKDAQDVMDFEKGLVMNAIKYKDERDDLKFEESMQPVSTLTASYGFLDWKAYIKTVIGNGTSTKTITDSTKILVLNAKYLEQLNKTLADTPRRVLANYMMWYALRPIIAWTCVTWIATALPIPLQKTYLEMFGSFRRKVFIIEMIHIMQREMKESIGLLDWLDDRAKLQASSQIDEIYLRLVSTDSLDHYEYMKYYKNVDVSGNFSFLLNLYNKWLDNKFDLLVTGVERTSWDMVLLVLEMKLYSVKLVYTAADNSLTILDGFLQQPVHGEDWPGYMNYGRLGSSVGHMLTHSLDYRGSHFDNHGRPRDWWDADSRDRFKVKEKCFIQQFGKFKKYDADDDFIEIAESIAGTGALKLGFEAYRKFEDSLILQDLLLPDLPYTQEQLYYISYAQLHCSRDLDPVSQVVDFLPAKFKVSSSVQNNDYFGDVFKCKKGANMNPTEKCEVWT